MQLLFLSFLFGGFIALLVWNTYQVVEIVPAEDRAYLDRPPYGFRLVWPLVRMLVHYVGFLVSHQYRLVTHMRLKRAGVDYSLSPEQFMAGKVISAFVALLFAYVLQLMLDSLQTPAIPLMAFVAGFFYPELWLRETTATRNRKILRALPFYLDIITLSVEAGSNLTGGLTQAVQKAPESPLRTEFSRVLRDVRAGKRRADALRDLSDRVSCEGVHGVVSSMIQAEKTGSSLGKVLRAQADQIRSTRFLKAEKMAMEAPVKLLGPLVLFIFPNTFLVLGFLLVSKAIQDGVLTWAPLVRAFYWPG